MCLHANRFNLLVANTIIVANPQKVSGSIPELSIFFSHKVCVKCPWEGPERNVELGSSTTLTTLLEIENELKVKIFHRLFRKPFA